jgi:Pectate lyase superfamily protein
MKTGLLVIIVFLNTLHLFAQEEFNGPLPGWANVKTRFGAKGDGIHDDTKAIQQALDSLTQPVVNYNKGKNAYVVIYLPAGVYCISSTLSLKGKIGVSFIGESPVSTTILWKGPDNDTMFFATGTAYFKVSRFTWNAGGHKGIEAIGLHWKEVFTDSRSTSSAPVNIEFSDNVFTGNCKYGISGGTVAGGGMNGMDSEISIRRCVFNACTEAGIQIKGYNALDYWIWDCRFIDCKDGINCIAGNYHVYRSYFKASKYADVHNTNGYYTSVRGCYSEGSNIFSHDEGASSNPFKRVFQANTVINPTTTPIGYYHLGKITLLDNIFDVAKDTSVHAFVETGSWAPGNIEVLSINNKFGYKTPVKFMSGPNHIYSTNDNYGFVTKASGSGLFINAQDKMPAKVTRTVLVVPAGAGSKTIQTLINQAVKLKGTKPVIYFPFGRYILEEPLVIAQGSDLQLTGDGYLYATELMPAASFPGGKAMINVKGPSSVVIRDMMLNKFTTTMDDIIGIQFSNIDQPGSQAFIEQLYTNSHRSVYADGLDYLYIQQTNSFFSDGKMITGGPLVQKGKGTAGLFCFGGQHAGLQTDKNAVAVIKDCWWEGALRKPLDFTGSGRITIDGAMIAPAAADSATTVSINRFSGKISLLNMYLEGGVNVEKNNPELSLLLWNIHFYFTLDPLKFITPDANYRAAFMGLTTQCFFPGDKKCDNIFTVQNTFKGNVKTENFLPEMLADDRSAMPRKYTPAPSGASSIFVSRVSAGDCKTTISFIK